jgi:hypothetical protein
MDPANLLTKWHWIVELARKKPGAVLFSLNHVIDFEWMREAYIRTRKDGATGIDGVTAQDYEANLEANLRDLLERIKSGSYEAPPVRRTYVPNLLAYPAHHAAIVIDWRCLRGRQQHGLAPGQRPALAEALRRFCEGCSVRPPAVY